MMTGIRHHVPDPILMAYASGRLPRPFGVVVAAHVSMCDECRSRLGAHDAAGGAVLELGEAVALSERALEAVMSRLDDPFEPARPARPSGIYPSPLVEEMKALPPRWKRLGGGAHQDIILKGPQGSLRLLHIPAGKPVPEHGHGGLEMTLILQGSFSDRFGRFSRGDLEVADEDVEHQPWADEGEDCICLAATSAPLRFSAWLPRLLQPIFRI